MYSIISMFFIIGLLVVVLGLGFAIGWVMSVINKFNYKNNKSIYGSRKHRRW